MVGESQADQSINRPRYPFPTTFTDRRTAVAQNLFQHLATKAQLDSLPSDKPHVVVRASQNDWKGKGKENRRIGFDIAISDPANQAIDQRPPDEQIMDINFLRVMVEEIDGQPRVSVAANPELFNDTMSPAAREKLIQQIEDMQQKIAGLPMFIDVDTQMGLEEALFSRDLQELLPPVSHRFRQIRKEHSVRAEKERATNQAAFNHAEWLNRLRSIPGGDIFDTFFDVGVLREGDTSQQRVIQERQFGLHYLVARLESDPQLIQHATTVRSALQQFEAAYQLRPIAGHTSAANVMAKLTRMWTSPGAH